MPTRSAIARASSTTSTSPFSAPATPPPPALIVPPPRDPSARAVVVDLLLDLVHAGLDAAQRVGRRDGGRARGGGHGAAPAEREGRPEGQHRDACGAHAASAEERASTVRTTPLIPRSTSP